jgi:hypothetical protein
MYVCDPALNYTTIQNKNKPCVALCNYWLPNLPYLEVVKAKIAHHKQSNDLIQQNEGTDPSTSDTLYSFNEEGWVA